MNIILIFIGLAAIPMVFLTMYAKTSEGLKLPLGSFFIIRKFTHEFIRVRSFKDIYLLVARLIFAALIALLLIDPSNVGSPARNVLVHKSAEKQKEIINERHEVRLIAPPEALDKFDEDLFFLDSFVKNYRTSGNISILYNPTERTIGTVKGDIVIFPSKRQPRSAFQKWIEIFDFSSMRMGQPDLKIKDTGISVKAYYPILITDPEKITKYAELADGSAVAVSFNDSGRRILLFGTGVSASWGDIGVSGYFIDIIERFINNSALSPSVGAIHESPLQEAGNKSATGKVTSLLSFSLILKIASIIFLIELLLFILPRTTRNTRKTQNKIILFLFVPFVYFVVQMFFIPAPLMAEDFKFIELTQNGEPGESALMFSMIKRELEDKTSIKISPDFYRTHSANSMINGSQPEFPYLWIFGCSNIKYSRAIMESLSGFVARGGIIFFDPENARGGLSCMEFFKELGVKISGAEPVKLPSDHPVYKSFYLIYNESFSGADASISTKRTALMISGGNFRQRVITGDPAAVKAGVNIVLYMLSGNYKSDQIHTRYILERLKKREFR